MSFNIQNTISNLLEEKDPELDPLFLPRDFSQPKNETTIEELYNPRPGTRAAGKWDNFYNWDDERVIQFLNENHFTHHRKLEDGSWVAIQRLMFTWSVCCDITQMSPYAYRWCFQDLEEAEYFIATIKEFDEVPVRKESLKGHRYHDGQARYVKFDELGFKMW